MLFNSYNDLLNYKIQQCRKEKVTAEKLFELMLYFANEASENYQELVMIENKCRKLHGINIAEDFTKEDIHAIKPFKLSKYEIVPEEIDVPGEMIKTNEYRVVFERVENSVFGPIYMEGDKAQNVHKSDNLEVKDVEECFIKTEETKEPDVSNIQNEIKPIEEKVEEPTNPVEPENEKEEEKEYYVTSFEERMQNRGWNKVTFENKNANETTEEKPIKKEQVEEPVDTTPKEVEEPKKEVENPQVQLEKEEAINNTFNKLNEELEKVGIDSEDKIETFAESKKEEIRQRVEEEIAKIKDSDIVTKIEEQIENGKERIGEVVAKEVTPTVTQLEKQEVLASLDKVANDGVLVGEPQTEFKEDEKVEETVAETEKEATLAQKEEPTLTKEETPKEVEEEPYEFINSDISPLGVGHQGTTKMSSGYEFSLDDLLKK